MQQTTNSEETKKYPYTTSVVSNGRRKFHTTFENKEELVEEYDLQSSRLVVRKSRKPTTLGGDAKWEFEIGEPEESEKQRNALDNLLSPSTTNVLYYFFFPFPYFLIYKIANFCTKRYRKRISMESTKLLF